MPGMATCDRSRHRAFRQDCRESLATSGANLLKVIPLVGSKRLLHKFPRFKGSIRLGGGHPAGQCVFGSAGPFLKGDEPGASREGGGPPPPTPGSLTVSGDQHLPLKP